MKKQIILSLKRILCIGLALNIIYTSVDFSALNVWAEEEVTESTENEEPDTEILKDTGENTVTPEDGIENPTGEAVEENTDKTGTTDTQENQGGSAPEEGEESEEKGFLEGLKNLIAPFGLAPFSEGEEEPEEVKEVVPIEGATFTTTVSLDGTYASLKDSSVPVKVYMHGKTDEGDLPYYEGTLIFTENNKGTISGIPVYITKGTGALPEGSGKFETPEDFYEIELQKTISENREYIFAFEDEQGTNSFVDLNININSLRWSGTSKEKLNATKRPSYDYDITTTFFAEDPTEEFPFAPEDIKLVSSYTLDETPCTMEYTPTVTFLGNAKFRLSYSDIAKESGMELKLSIPSTARDGSLSYVPYKKDNGYQEVTENKIDFITSSSNYEQYVNDLLFIQAETITGQIKWLDNEDKNHPEVDDSFRVSDETLKSYISLFNAGTNTKITDFDYDKNVSVNQNATGSEPAIKISSVPMYNTQGHLLNYYFKLEKEGSGNNEIPAVDTNNQHTFKIIYDNGVNSTITDYGFDEATVIFTLTKIADAFSFTMKWLDDSTGNTNQTTQYNNPENKARNSEMDHGITFYLWRYADNGQDTDANNAAPVYDEHGNQYYIKLDSSNPKFLKDEIVIERKDFKKDQNPVDDFPHYNENGVPYKYYVTIVNDGHCYDVQFEGSEEYVKQGETVQFVRSGKDALRARLEWKARGEADYLGAKGILEVQRRLAHSEGEWQSIPNGVDADGKEIGKTTLTTFSASATTPFSMVFFEDLDLYDEMGRTYEFRVVELGIGKKDKDDYYFETEADTWSGYPEYQEKADWDMYASGTSQGKDQVLFRYGSNNMSEHGYKCDAEWHNYIYYNDSTNQIDLLINNYNVTNILFDTVQFTPEIRWNGNLNHYKDELNALLQRKQLTVDGYTTADYTGEKVEYVVGRNKEPYAKIVVEPDGNGTAYYNYYLWNKSTNNWNAEKEIRENIPTITTQSGDGYQYWLFSKGMLFPKYDNEGARYAYNLGTITDVDGKKIVDSKEYCHEHQKIEDDFTHAEPNDFLIRVEGSPLSTSQHPIVIHTLAVPGPNYSISVKVNWEDNLSDVAGREVDAHIVALRLVDGKYYLYKDLGAIDSENSTANAENRFHLIVENDFEGFRYYEPLEYKDIMAQNAKFTGEKAFLRIQETDAEDKERTQESFLNDLYYTVVQYSWKFGEDVETYYFPNISEGEVVPEEYLLINALHFDTPMHYSSTDPSTVYRYAYDTDVTTKSTKDFNYTIDNRSHHKEFLNKLRPITTNINLEINWHDDNNTSSYRKDKLIVQLYQEVGDEKEKPVSDGSNQVKTIVWNTDSAINKYTYKADESFTSGGIESTSSNYVTEESSVGGFSNLPLTNANGDPITYSIRQYVVPDDGTDIYNADGTVKEEYRILENSTEKFAKNNYYAHCHDDRVYAAKDPYRQYFKIVVNNYATNLNYTADFYIVWHDEDAYRAGARSDMKYVLYYDYVNEQGTDSGLQLYTRSDFNSVLDTAEVVEGSKSNPFYQKLSFHGLTEFIDGLRVHYFVQEIKTSSNEGYYQYRIDYYDNDKTELTEGNPFYANPSNQKHRIFTKDIKPKKTWINENQTVNDGYYIAQDQVVVNYLSSIIEVNGSKKWVNLAKDAEKPDCDIYLFRNSVHDSLHVKPVLADGMTQVDLESAYKEYKLSQTELNDEKTAYSFENVPDGKLEGTNGFSKFDEYGASYTYTIGEIIHGKDGRAVAVEIMEGNSEGNMLLTNTYDKEGKNSRDITIYKEWFKDTVDLVPDTAHNPVAKFYIYRMECNYSVVDPTDSTKQLFPEADKVDFQTVVAGMHKNEDTPWDVFLKNLAADSSSTCKLVHTTTLRQGSEPSKRITGLNIFAPNGKPYVYFVVEDKDYVESYTISNSGKKDSDAYEKAPLGYYLADNVVFVSNDDVKINADESVSNSDTRFSNHLIKKNFIKIKGPVLWNEGVTAIGKTARPGTGNVSNSIELELYRYSNTQEELGKNGNSFALTKVNYDNVTWTFDETNNQWNYEITGTFPQYAENGKPYYYQVKEKLKTGDDNQKISENYTISTNDPKELSTKATDNVLTVGKIENTLRGTYTVTKHWTDGYDSYGMRPNRVLVMFQYKEEDGSTGWKLLNDKNGKTIVLELNDGNEWKSSFRIFPFSTKDSVKYRYRVVEIALGYDKGNNTTNWANTIDLAKLSISSINNDNYKAGEKRCVFGSNTIWDYVTNDNTTNDYYAYSTTIANLPDIYQNNNFRSVNTFGSYRVYPGDKDGITFGDNKVSHTTTIENKLEASTGFKIIKHWVDDDHDRFGTRPEKIEIRLQKKQWSHEDKPATDASIQYENIEAEFNKDEGWTDITTNRYFISNTDVQKNDDDNLNPDTWELELQNLPLYDDEGYRIAYRAFEIGDTGVLNKIVYDTGSNIYTIQSSQENNTLGNYYLSAYSLNSDNSSNTNNITVQFWNTLNTVADKTISVDKDWIIKGESESGDTYAVTNGYQSTVQAILSYKNTDESKTAQLTSEINLTGDSSTSGYQFAWNKIPAYAWVNEGTEEAPNYQKYTTLSNIEVKEIKTKLGTDASENEVDYTNHSIQSASDTAVIGTFTAGEQDWLVKNTKNSDGSFTITNTPLTKHSLEVRYTNDADAETNYQTRPNNAFVKLQYRVEGDSDWNDVDDSIKVQLLNSVTYENVKIENANATPTAPDSANPDGIGDSSPTPADEPNYKAIISQLPEFVKTDSVIKKYQYRIVETDVQYGENSKLNVPYDDNATKDTLTVKEIKDRTSDTSDTGNTDRTVAGYTYAYDNSNASVTKLEKAIALVGLKGSKVWDDQNNKFNTRPTLETDGEIQTGDSSIKVTLKKGTAQTDVTANTTVTWKDIGSNKWSYETTQDYPKYATGTDTYETYTVTETITNKKDYEPSYGENLSSATRNAISGNEFAFTDITNELQKEKLNVEKHWPSGDFNITPVSVTYTVQRKNGDGVYTTLLDSVNTAITAELKYEERDKDSNVTTAEIPDLPLCDSVGNAYEYRILETEVKVSFTDSSNNPHEVTYKLDLESNKIKEFIGDSTTASREKYFNATVLNADTFTYQIGPFDAKYEKTDSAYKYTNSIHTASASAKIEWSETKVGETALDATLVQKFRPDQLDLELQRKVKGSVSPWSNVTSNYTNSSDSKISITNISKDNTTDAANYSVAKIEHLPIFVFEDGEVKEYEYRIVEKQFGYDQADSTIITRPITYTGTISSDFDGSTKELNGLDTVNSKAFYNCSNKNVTVDGSYEYKTEIKNTLKSDELINLVDATLSGTVLWKDNANALNKRPDGTDTDKGVSLRIKAKKADTNETYELGFTMGNTEALAGGTSGISIIGLEKTNNNPINVTWTKEAANWNYTITGLPMFDQKGNYLIYSICSEKNPTDYDAKADNSDATNQHTDENQKYAFGTVTDFTSGKYETTAINHVDFVENMTTKLTVTKQWDGDSSHYWQTRPNDLYVALQYRLVDSTGNSVNDSDWQFWDNQTYSLGTEYPSTAKNWEDEFKKDVVVNAPEKFYKLHKPSVDGSGITEWKYEATLPLYNIKTDGTYQFIQYRVLEIGKTKTGNLELLDETKKPGSNPNRDELSHIGSYYMKEYATSWAMDTGYSTSAITNTFDTRQSITVKKIWRSDVSDDEKKTVKVKLIGMVSNSDGHVTNVESVFEHELPIVSGDNKIWEFTYEDLPQYNLDSQTVEWHVEEILVDGVAANDIVTTNNTRVAATMDGNWIGFYGEDTTSGAGTINRTFTVTNIPSTSAKLTVNYAEDMENIYGTRFTSTKAVLQYRVKDSDDVWQAVANTTENNLADQIIQNTTKTGYITGTVALENGQIVISQQNEDTSGHAAATYVYAIQNLPKYYDKDATEELEYRLVEIQQGTNVSVSYSDASENAINASDIAQIQLAEIGNGNNDKASAGYEYLYTTNNGNQSDAVLTKTLKNVYIPGTKTWEDQSNAHNTRPGKENGTATGVTGEYTQMEASAVKITVLRAGTVMANQPAITWKTENNTSTDVWTYISGNLPKYMPQENTIAQYTVEESCTSSQYASQVSGFDVINTLHIIYVEVEKTDAENNAPLSGVKFGLYPYVSATEIASDARYTATTDENGKAIFHVVDTDMYDLQEMSAPTGYQVVTNPAGAPLNLSEESYSTTKTFKVEDPRKLGELIIYKQDSKSTMDNPIPLNDVKFELYKKQEGNFVQEMWWFLTGKQYKFHQEAEMNIATGTAKITDIPWGEYYIVETETNTGYVLSTDKYYFKVNAETVGHPIELWSIDTFVDSSKKIIDNTITNYKNKFYFQKEAVGTQNVLTGGTFEIHKASGEKVGESFTLNDTSPVEFEGFEVGEYYIKEVSAPTNYAKAEDLYFSISDIGEIKDAGGQVIADKILVMEDMPLCNFKVTKVFTGDATWKNSIRPGEVEIQLYAYRTDSGEASKTAVGTPKKITVNTTNDTYNYTFENLPMYEVENGTAHALSYIAEEVPTGDTMYTVSYSTVSVQGGTAVAGCTYEETITNEIVATDVQNIFISKVNNGGPQDAEFDLQVTFWKVDTHKHFYIDSYSAGTWNDGTKDIDSADSNSVGQDGMLKIKHNQTVKFTLPKGVDYSVEEIFSENTTPEYKVEPGSFVPNNLGDNKQRISITNTKQVYTAINNTTENLDNTGSKQTNAGGTVAVIEHTSNAVITENLDKVDYTSGKYCVHWTPKKDWENENTFTVNYKKTAEETEETITVEKYLDKNGNLIPAHDESGNYISSSIYDELHTIYKDFRIDQNSDTKEIYLYLSNNIEGMPYLNQVNVEFIPTIAVANITDGRVGGGVKIEASDFKPNSEGMLENQTDGRLSHKKKIYAQAEEGYYIDLRETELGLVGKVLTTDMMTKDAAGVGLLLTTYSLAEDMPLLADGTGANKITLNGDRFSKTLQYDSGSYTLTGRITVLERNAGNNPTSIVMEVDELSLPIDIGIVFKKYVPKKPDSNPGETEDSISDASGKEETAKTISALTEKDGVAPKTGDDNSLYVWYLLFLMSLGYILNDFAKTRNKKDQ